MPIVSEEQAAPESRRRRRAAATFWSIRSTAREEFIAGRDEYTVNIALMTDGVPLLGIIARRRRNGLARHRRPRRRTSADCGWHDDAPARSTPGRGPADEFLIMVSRSHLDERTQAYVGRFPQAELVQCGSSVKFCRVAEGAADLYPRLAPTHDWDIAAGHAILTAAGGEVTAPDGAPLRYGSAGALDPGFRRLGRSDVSIRKLRRERALHVRPFAVGRGR